MFEQGSSAWWSLYFAGLLILGIGAVGLGATVFSRRCDTCDKKHGRWACHPKDLKDRFKSDTASDPDQD
jgi:hypothetical protein